AEDLELGDGRPGHDALRGHHPPGDRVVPGAERLEEDEVRVHGGGLERAGEAGVEDRLQAQVSLEEEQAIRVDVVVQDVVQRLPIEGDVDLRDVRVASHGTGEEEVEEALTGGGLEGGVRAGKVVEDGREADRQRL